MFEFSESEDDSNPDFDMDEIFNKITTNFSRRDNKSSNCRKIACDLAETDIQCKLMELLCHRNTKYPSRGGLLLMDADLKGGIINEALFVGASFGGECNAHRDIEHMVKGFDVISVPILCCVGPKGSGKTVLQAMNSKYFGELTNGIAIIISLNDEPSFLTCDYDAILSGHWKPFSISLSVRIIYRILEHFLGIEEAANHVQLDSSLMQSILQCPDPFQSILGMLPQLVGAPSDVKILLCIDEVMDNRPSVSSPRRLFLNLINGLANRFADKPSVQRCFLSIASKSASDITKLVSHFDKLIRLQPLLPSIIPYNIPTEHIDHLPPILRYCYDSQRRDRILYDERTYSMCNDLVKLLIATGGHAGRMAVLFQSLRMFVMPNTMKDVVDGFDEWLHQCLSPNTKQQRTQQIIAEMDKYLPCFPDNAVQHLSGSFNEDPSKMIDIIEQLALDVARSFFVPKGYLACNNKRHEATICGADQGHWTIVTAPQRAEYFCLISIAMLDLFPKHLKLKSCGKALLQLGDALKACCIIDQHQNRQAQKGSFDGVILSSLLLKSSSVVRFQLPSLCDKDRYGSDMKVTLDSCNNVEVWDDIDLAVLNDPSTADATHQISEYVQTLLNRLPRCYCALFMQKDKHYNSVVGLYNYENIYERGFAMLIIDTVDWFYTGSSDDMVKEWRRHRQGIPSSVECMYNGKKETVKFLFLLFSVKDVSADVTCAHNEGIATLQSIKNWCPTAGYGLEFAMSLQKLFAPA